MLPPSVTFDQYGVCPQCRSLLGGDDPLCAECAASRPESGWDSLEHEIDPWLGRTLIDRYRVVQRVGVGGTARVYRVDDLKLPRRFALKIVDLETKGIGTPAEIEERVRREASIVSGLHNPHVVPILDMFQPSPRTVALLMGFAAGDTLHDRVTAKGPLSAELALDVVAQVAVGLGGAHDAGVVHRDVKPGNLMLQELRNGDFHVRILDFGIAYVPDNDESTAGFLGTPQYASPEQIENLPVGPSTDVYAIGATLYFALTGLPPFTRDSSIATIRAHVLDPVPRLSDAGGAMFSPELEHFVGRLLSKSPADRPQSMAELLSEIDLLRENTTWSEVIDANVRQTRELVAASNTVTSAISAAAAIPSNTACMAQFPIEGQFRAGALASMTRGRVVSIADGDVAVTTLSPRMVQRIRSDHADLAMSLASSDVRLLMGTHDGDVWCQVNGDWMIEFSAPDRAPISAIAVTPDDGATAVGTGSGDVFVRHGAGEWAAITIKSPIWAISLSPSGTTLAVATQDRVQIVDLSGHGVALVIEATNVVSISFSEDEYLVATVERDGAAIVWALGGDQPVRLYTRKRDGEPVLAAYFAHDTLLGLCSGASGAFLVDLRCEHSHFCRPSCTRCEHR